MFGINLETTIVFSLSLPFAFLSLLFSPEPSCGYSSLLVSSQLVNTLVLNRSVVTLSLWWSGKNMQLQQQECDHPAVQQAASDAECCHLEKLLPEGTKVLFTDMSVFLVDSVYVSNTCVNMCVDVVVSIGCPSVVLYLWFVKRSLIWSATFWAYNSLIQPNFLTCKHYGPSVSMVPLLRSYTFIMAARIWIQNLMLMWQALYQLSHLSDLHNFPFTFWVFFPSHHDNNMVIQAHLLSHHLSSCSLISQVNIK